MTDNDAPRRVGAASNAQLIKVAEVAQIAAISPRTLWRLVSEGKFPQPVRIGSCTRWRLAEIERWIVNGCTDPQNDQQ